MNNLSANEVASASAKLGSWIPQVYFDLLARVMPGSLALIILGVCVSGVDHSFSLISNWMASDPGFPLVLIILVAMTGASYTFAIIVWGIWYGLCVFLRKIKIMDPDADPETGVLLKEDNFPKIYEKIKSCNQEAGSRLTKLKA